MKGQMVARCSICRVPVLIPRPTMYAAREALVAHHKEFHPRRWRRSRPSDPRRQYRDLMED